MRTATDTNDGRNRKAGRGFLVRQRSVARTSSWLLGATAVLLAACGGDDDAQPVEIGFDDVVEEVRSFVDATRSTPANGEFAGSAERDLPTRVWFSPSPLRRPACNGNGCALILLAHGFGGRSERFDAIGQRLAAAGYIVAAPTFPLTNQDAPGGHLTGIGDAREQAADLSAVIDGLIEVNDDPSDPLFDRVDAARIGAMGHSLGGATVLAATRASCCRDARIAVTAYVEPAATLVAALFGSPYTAGGPPVLTFQGEVDFPIAPQATRAFHASLEPPKILVEMAGGNHINMIERFAEEPDPLLDSAGRMMIAFFDHYLAGNSSYDLEERVRELRNDGHTVSYSP